METDCGVAALYKKLLLSLSCSECMLDDGLHAAQE